MRRVALFHAWSQFWSQLASVVLAWETGSWDFNANARRINAYC